jgi:hypothetical protein
MASADDKDHAFTFDAQPRKRNPLRQAPAHFIRKMEQEDVEEVAEVWRLIGLHEGIQTIRTFMQVDPDGFVVAISQESGEKRKRDALFTASFVVLMISCRQT